MTAGACFWSSVLSISSSWPTLCSSRRIGSRQHGDIHAPYIGISWTTSWLGSMTWETYYTPEWCPVQTATLIIGWYAANSPLPSGLLPREKVSRWRSCKCTNFRAQGWKTISKSCWRKDFIVWQLQSLRNSGSRWRPYYRKPGLKLLACQPENAKTGLTKQIRKSKSCLKKKNAPPTITCLQNLIIKLPRVHARLPAVHSRLSLEPSRIIGEQHLLRGHNTTLTKYVQHVVNKAMMKIGRGLQLRSLVPTLLDSSQI